MSNQTKRKFNEYAGKLRTAILTRQIANAINTAKLNNKTLSQYLATITKTTIGLQDVLNYPNASNAEAINSGVNTRYLTPQTGRVAVDKSVEVNNNIVGAMAGASTTGTNTDLLCTRLNVVKNQSEQDAVVSAVESFATVFNDWTRYSHQGSLGFPANPSEITSWSYNAQTDRIACTVNSVSHIGFVSSDFFGDYDFEVEVSSTNADDDRIGIVLAFVEENGQQHTITAFRQLDNAAHFGVYYNYLLTGNLLLGSNDAGYPWPNTWTTTLGTLKNGWAGFGTARIKVRRRGDIFELWTTLANDTVYMEDKKITIDLNSRPELAKFKGAVRFGYACQSQALASWRSIVRPGAKNPIVRTDTLACLVWENDAWVTKPAGTHRNYVKANRLYTNQTTKRLFFAETQDTIFEIAKRP